MDYKHIEFRQHIYVDSILSGKKQGFASFHKMTKYTNHIYFNKNTELRNG